MVAAKVLDVWADAGQMGVYTEVAATFPAWHMETRIEDGVFKVRYSLL